MPVHGTELDPRVAERREAVVAMIVNTCVWLSRLLAGIASGSYALIADAWHALSDTATSALVLIGSHIAAKPPDEEHPYGHGRAADIASFLLGLALIALSLFLILSPLMGPLYRHEIATEFALTAVLVIVLTSIVKETLARYALRLHNVSGSILCRADAWHHRLDALLGIAVLPVFVTAIVLPRAAPYVDLACSLLIAGLIAKEGIEIVYEAASVLSDATRRDIVEKVLRAVNTMPDIVEVHDVRVRTYGGYIFIEMKIHVDPRKTVEEAHRLCEELEAKIKELDKRVLEVLIHIEPTTSHR